MKYRVNFGQGQVGATHNSLKEAQRELASYEDCGGAFIQWLDVLTGDWHHAKWLRATSQETP